ncbi:hypothetical protein MRB53_011032 [Persea americana]|uniref:Uncharacterized protein n=1 Tax=Persea americana TaxID=3435 RepID=A0ACC2LTM3_PERAE|nr:hypothetical protein MRB53_011032 [Persea americana]
MMSKSTLEQVREHVLRLEEKVEGLNEANTQQISFGPRLTVLAEKTDSIEELLKDRSAQLGELRADIQTWMGQVQQQFDSLSNELTLMKRAIHGSVAGSDKRRVKGWAQAELRRQNVKDLTAAVAAAEALVDYKAERTESADAEKSKSKGSKNGKKKNGNGDDGKDKQFNGNSEPGKPSMANSGCFICQGPHRARECPKKEKLNALVAVNEQGEKPGGFFLTVADIGASVGVDARDRRLQTGCEDGLGDAEDDLG